jgi:hypothetical protein
MSHPPTHFLSTENVYISTCIFCPCPPSVLKLIPSLLPAAAPTRVVAGADGRLAQAQLAIDDAGVDVELIVDNKYISVQVIRTRCVKRLVRLRTAATTQISKFRHQCI